MSGLCWPSPLWGLRSTRPKLRTPLTFPSPASFKLDKWCKPHPIITQCELCPMLANVFHHCLWSRHDLLPAAHTSGACLMTSNQSHHPRLPRLCTVQLHKAPQTMMWMPLPWSYTMQSALVHFHETPRHIMEMWHVHKANRNDHILQ